MTRPNLEAELELIHKVCHYIRQVEGQGSECHKCSYTQTVGDDDCMALCVGMAEELILIVRTGDPWDRGDGSWPSSK